MIFGSIRSASAKLRAARAAVRAAIWSSIAAPSSSVRPVDFSVPFGYEQVVVQFVPAGGITV